MDRLDLCMTAPQFFPVCEDTGSYTMELIKHLPRDVDVNVVMLKRNISNLSENGLEGKSVDSAIDRPLQIHYLSTANETVFYNLAFQIACFKSIYSKIE